jgi:hypothetical protein
MRGKRITYSAEEMAWLAANYALPISQYHDLFLAFFARYDVNKLHLHSLRKRNGWRTGRTGRFAKGTEPPNKGRTCAPGSGGRHPNAQKTQFKKGQLPHNTKGPGHERICKKDGYVIMIVAETNPWSGAATRPVHKHRWLWEQVNGPVPEGMALKCIDSNKLNTDPSNWELAPRALLARLNGGPRKKRIAYDQAPDELKPAIMAVAKIKQRSLDIRRAMEKQREAS